MNTILIEKACKHIREYPELLEMRNDRWISDEKFQDAAQACFVGRMFLLAHNCETVEDLDNLNLKYDAISIIEYVSDLLCISEEQLEAITLTNNWAKFYSRGISWAWSYNLAFDDDDLLYAAEIALKMIELWQLWINSGEIQQQDNTLWPYINNRSIQHKPRN